MSWAFDRKGYLGWGFQRKCQILDWWSGNGDMDMWVGKCMSETARKWYMGPGGFLRLILHIILPPETNAVHWRGSE